MDSSNVPIDFLVGVDEADLVAMKAKCVALLKEGKTVMSYTVQSGVSTGKQMVMPIPQLLNAVRYALQKIDPDTYGLRISRTYASFHLST